MNNIPTQLENPSGLHQRYLIKKLVRHVPTFLGEIVGEEEIIQVPTDEG